MAFIRVQKLVMDSNGIIISGSVTVADGQITFKDLTVKNPTDGSIYVHNGTVNAKFATGRDYSKYSTRLMIAE